MERESSETSKVFIRKEKARHMDGLRESCFGGDLNCLYEGMDFPGFLWPIILLVAHIWSDSGSFGCACISFSQDGFTQESLRGWQDMLWIGASSLP